MTSIFIIIIICIFWQYFYIFSLNFTQFISDDKFQELQSCFMEKYYMQFEGH